MDDDIWGGGGGGGETGRSGGEMCPKKDPHTCLFERWSLPAFPSQWLTWTSIGVFRTHLLHLSIATQMQKARKQAIVMGSFKSHNGLFPFREITAKDFWVLLSFLKVFFGSDLPGFLNPYNHSVFCTKMGSESSSHHKAGCQGLWVATSILCGPLFVALYKLE